MPLDCGSTSVSTICTATAASTALPPSRSTCAPASVASGLAAATTWRLKTQPGLAALPEANSGCAGGGASPVNRTVPTGPAQAPIIAPSNIGNTQRNKGCVRSVMDRPDCEGRVFQTAIGLPEIKPVRQRLG